MTCVSDKQNISFSQQSMFNFKSQHLKSPIKPQHQQSNIKTYIWLPKLPISDLTQAFHIRLTIISYQSTEVAIPTAIIWWSDSLSWKHWVWEAQLGGIVSPSSTTICFLVNYTCKTSILLKTSHFRLSCARFRGWHSMWPHNW